MGDIVCSDKQTYQQRGAGIMAQGLLAFKYEEEKVEKGMTGLFGLSLYMGKTKGKPFMVGRARHGAANSIKKVSDCTSAIFRLIEMA
jgi:hypothetical protein